ncbi:MAG: hypothetical protein ACK496_03180 [Acidobacteriota bacterium]
MSVSIETREWLGKTPLARKSPFLVSYTTASVFRNFIVPHRSGWPG